MSVYGMGLGIIAANSRHVAPHGDDPNPLSPRRYWRLLITNSNGTVSCISELYLKDKDGNALAGTWTANTSGNGAAASVADGNGGTFWGSSGVPSVPSPNWIQLDLGAGNSGLPDLIDMTARSGFSNQMPRDFTLQYSDDGAAWSNATNYSWLLFNSAELKAVRVRPYIVQFYFDDPQNGSYTTVSELEVLSAGADLTLPATTSIDSGGAIFGSNDGNEAKNAFDNNAGNYTGNAGNPSFTEYRFWTTPTFDSVSVTVRGGGFGNQGPKSFKVRTSRDGFTWVVKSQIPVQAAWGDNERRVFSV